MESMLRSELKKFSNSLYNFLGVFCFCNFLVIFEVELKSKGFVAFVARLLSPWLQSQAYMLDEMRAHQMSIHNHRALFQTTSVF